MLCSRRAEGVECGVGDTARRGPDAVVMVTRFGRCRSNRMDMAGRDRLFASNMLVTVTEQQLRCQDQAENAQSE